jgi:hypothetical protein
MEPERAADRAQSFADITMRIVGALKGLEVFFVPADQVRRQRQLLEILSLKWTLLIRVRKRLERICLGALAIGPAGSIKFARRCCHRIDAGHGPHMALIWFWFQASIAEQIGD